MIVKRTFFILTIFFWALSCRMVNISNDLLETRSEEHFLNHRGILSFNNTNGDLNLSEWDNDFIQVETTIYGDSARGIPPGLHILTEELEDALSYTVEYPGGPAYVSVDFDVKVPARSDYRLNVVTVNGETAIDADLMAFVESVNGDIMVKALSSPGLFTVNGDITAALEQQIEDFAVETVNGDICIELSKELDLVLETMNGDITVDGSSYDKDVTIIGDSDASAALKTLNGDIDVQRID